LAKDGSLEIEITLRFFVCTFGQLPIKVLSHGDNLTIDGRNAGVQFGNIQL
jgi:hypothetical protein